MKILEDGEEFAVKDGDISFDFSESERTLAVSSEDGKGVMILWSDDGVDAVFFLGDVEGELSSGYPMEGREGIKEGCSIFEGIDKDMVVFLR